MRVGLLPIVLISKQSSLPQYTSEGQACAAIARIRHVYLWNLAEWCDSFADLIAEPPLLVRRVDMREKGEREREEREGRTPPAAGERWAPCGRGCAAVPRRVGVAISPTPA